MFQKPITGLLLSMLFKLVLIPVAFLSIFMTSCTFARKIRGGNVSNMVGGGASVERGISSQKSFKT